VIQCFREGNLSEGGIAHESGSYTCRVSDAKILVSGYVMKTYVIDCVSTLNHKYENISDITATVVTSNTIVSM
jgi:hypothetical protein